MSAKDVRRNTRVLLRVDANVPGSCAELAASSLTRLRESLPEITRLKARGAKILLATHWGDPGGRPDVMRSTCVLADAFARLLGVPVPCLPASIGSRVAAHVKTMKPGDIVMLENLRFLPGEETDSLALARRLAANADVYVNNAFGVSHKRHASVHAIAKCLPSFAGELVSREVRTLSRPLSSPFVLVLGGAKVTTKLPLMLTLGAKADTIVLGGGTALTFIAALGGKLSGAKAFTSREDVDDALEAADVIGNRLVLPRDLVFSPSRKAFVDIGPRSVAHALKHIATAKTIVWNGPMGLIEDPAAQRGTEAIARAIAARRAAYTTIGGGETVAFVESLGLTSAFDHVSTGGGAMLAFLAGEPMPGLEALYR